MSVPRVSFVNSGGIDVAFLLNSLSPKSFIPHSRQKVPRKLEGISYMHGGDCASLFTNGSL